MPATHRKGGQGSSYLDNLTARAKSRPVDNFSSLTTYYRSADLLLRQADQYRRIHNEAELYVMLMKFASLIVETLPKHRSFVKSDPKYQALEQALVQKYFPEMERVKAGLRLAHMVEQLESEGPFRPTKTAGTILLSAGNLPELHWEASLPPATAPPPPPPPDAGAQLGVPQPAGFDLLSGLGLAAPAAATAASASAAAVARSSSSSSASSSVVDSIMGWHQQPAPSATQMPQIPELRPSIRLPAASQATLSKHALLPMGSFGSSGSSSLQHRPERQQASAAPLPQRPLYPELAELEPPALPQQQQQLPPLDAALASLDLDGRQQQADGLPLPQPPTAQQQQQVPPYPQPSPYAELQLGPQEVGVMTAPRPTQPLPPDATCCPPPPPQQEFGPAPPQPQPPASSGGVAEVKKLQNIRDVHVSVALMDEFMRFAVSNTRRGIETCGILAGVLSADDAVFTITTLIVPKQEGTTDTVAALNEEEIFEVQDSRALYPLGWIHTHPTQTCFLSSVDVHTHCGYQTMLDEAVAIVMAPKDPTKRVGIFRLSTPGGLKLVQRCTLRGFHPHPPTATGQPVYELCGHVYLNPRAKYEVIDLR